MIVQALHVIHHSLDGLRQQVTREVDREGNLIVRTVPSIMAPGTVREVPDDWGREMIAAEAAVEVGPRELRQYIENVGQPAPSGAPVARQTVDGAEYPRRMYRPADGSDLL